MMIPCGDGFLYVGACGDTCGSPYAPEDTRIGHECCSTVAAEVERLHAALGQAERDLRDAMAMFAQAVVAAGGELRISQSALLVDAPEILRTEDPRTREIVYRVIRTRAHKET